MKILEADHHSMKNPVSIDIIIPIFNAFEYVDECLTSVLLHTSSEHRIILIDDKSSDRRIGPRLLDFKKRFSGTTILLRNSKNLGFVKTVNKGMRQSGVTDIILLNTDTIVTTGWVENLKVCAHSDASIATATPLTNNGNSICSVPAFGYVNEVPDGYSVNSFAKLVHQVSGRYYPDIPTAVGFCMFIKRSALNEIGLLDEEAFGQGYGEETDFALRASSRGWRNVVDDATYIYHKGHGTFDMLSVPASEREKKGLEILKKRYPKFIPDWKEFLNSNPLQPVHKRIYFGMWCRKWKVPEIFTMTLYEIFQTANHLKPAQH